MMYLIKKAYKKLGQNKDKGDYLIFWLLRKFEDFEFVCASLS
jgi:hypothetical protein